MVKFCLIKILTVYAYFNIFANVYINICISIILYQFVIKKLNYVLKTLVLCDKIKKTLKGDFL